MTRDPPVPPPDVVATAADMRGAEPDDRYRELLDDLPDAVLVNQGGRFVYGNKATCALLGYESPAAFAGVRIEDVVHPVDVSSVRAATANPDTSLRLVERRAVRRDGTTFTVEVSAAPAMWGGRPAHAIVARDVAARNELQATISRMERVVAVGMLAARVGHEVNNPLAYIMGNLELAADEVSDLLQSATEAAAPHLLASLPNRLTELGLLLADAREGAERVCAVVNDLRSLTVGSDAEKEVVSIPQALDVAAATAATELHHRARVLKDYGPVPDVLAHEARLVQAFVNLLLNAARNIPSGDASKHQVRLVTRTDVEGHAVVLIEDTGAGVPPAAVGGGLGTSFASSGGLSFSVSQMMLQTLGGDVSAETLPEGGTRLRVTLPGARPVQKPPSRPTPPAEAEARTRRARVLVVDDDPFIGRTVTRSLSRDHDVISTVRARDVLERLERGERFDLVLCDLMMPDLDGMELHAEVVQRFPDQAPRLAFMTGGAYTARARAFLDSGVLRLDKPFSAADVRDMVRRVAP
jgi:PAS domain S-box-containing protein